MKTRKKLTVALLICASLHSFCFADCPLDHFLIGCNADGMTGTEDDNKLFVDCNQKYRHSDPNNSGVSTWLNWHYPLCYNIRYDRYQIGEPGFDIIKADDPNRQLQGTANLDYQIIIECISIAPDFIAKNSTLGIELNQPGDWINHSALSDPHLHLEYRAPAPSGATNLLWIMYIIYDNFGNYESSEPFGLAFVKDPPSGDLVIDGAVDGSDLAELCYYWLEDNGERSNDYYERADADKNGIVNLFDFAMLASNWLK
ncbi:MAG: dockerin type I domain-containing protein [Phycisphaerae bacterium]|nr:dockerin type I domain-containing protein [Phycisphaerae bacterium]